jgi:hypothetical protein
MDQMTVLLSRMRTHSRDNAEKAFEDSDLNPIVDFVRERREYDREEFD